MQDPARIFDLCSTIRDQIVEYYAAQGVELPERQYVADSHLGIAIDCPQLAVACEGTIGVEGHPVFQTNEALTKGAGWAMRAGTFAVTIARCAAEQDDEGHTEVEDEEASAAAIYTDATLMLNALVTAAKAGELPGCGQLVFLSWRAAEEVNAELAASVLRVQIGLTG